MDKERVKGTADKAKGAIKDTAGKMTGDKDLQSEGKMEKAKGDLHNAARDVKNATTSFFVAGGKARRGRPIGAALF
jgi:uncharacterized protein YjbJ (UPF0337 family)